MKYTILKQWKTLDGSYYSTTVDKANYDLAFGEFHSMVKPMQNDTNVAYFRLEMIDENGGKPTNPISWTRQIPQSTEKFIVDGQEIGYYDGDNIVITDSELIDINLKEQFSEPTEEAVE